MWPWGKVEMHFIWARNGWEVTGFDLADEAVAYAVTQAEKENLDLNTQIASFDDYDFGKEKWHADNMAIWRLFG